MDIGEFRIVVGIIAGFAAVSNSVVAVLLYLSNRSAQKFQRDEARRGRSLLVWNLVSQLNIASMADPEAFDNFIKADWDPSESMEKRKLRNAAFIWLAPLAAQLETSCDIRTADTSVIQLLREGLRDPMVIRLIRTRGYPARVRQIAEAQIKSLLDDGVITRAVALEAAEDYRTNQSEILVTPQ